MTKLVSLGISNNTANNTHFAAACNDNSRDVWQVHQSIILFVSATNYEKLGVALEVMLCLRFLQRVINRTVQGVNSLALSETKPPPPFFFVTGYLSGTRHQCAG